MLPQEKAQGWVLKRLVLLSVMVNILQEKGSSTLQDNLIEKMLDNPLPKEDLTRAEGQHPIKTWLGFDFS